ncbi:hypothetical protein B0681_06680 [Moraxella porci DSM 25326]|uniref:Uncharacterized protein n=1 Tax=Moraxella porci DSM 25326 TaxID=573983 RepID=A0A1T0CR14_9GAMM|nr:hypothetical protein [Moraxella porci]OOS24808.1 hypothetical protein B0681_06680 [Moraxella porci DSM 25326]
MLYEELSKFQFSPSLYISGKRALNIIDSQNQTGDWHSYDAWYRPNACVGLYQVVGKGCQLDTTPYLGDLGVFHANELVYNKMGLPNFGDTVYCATHARAIADLVIAEAFFTPPFRGTSLFRTMSLFDFDDFMGMPEDKQKVYDLLQIAIPKLPKAQSDHVSEWLRLAKEKNYDL